MVRWTPEDPRVLRILIAAVALAAAHPSLASERGPSTPEERKRAVETTRKLEKNPLARSSGDGRRWLFQWIVDIPDIHVTSCSGPLDPLLKQEDDPYAQLLYVQSVFGMTAWLIENPKKADDWVSVQTAGLESALKAYEALLKSDPEATYAELDRVAKARKAGKLRALVQKEMAKCGEPQSDMGPAPSDAI
jgi:hypothetical protein